MFFLAFSFRRFYIDMQSEGNSFAFYKTYKNIRATNGHDLDGLHNTR